MPRAPHRAGAAILLGLAMALPAVADPHPAGMSNHPFNGPVDPDTRAGITTFRIEDKGCSRTEYEEGRGESDCRTGTVRSTLVSRKEESLGQSIEYRFDIQVGEGFAYEGFYNPEAAGFLPDLWDSRLRIAAWEGQGTGNSIYMLKLDARRGIDFAGRTCVPKERLGDWNSFSMKVRWAADERGWIKVTCNDRIVYLEETTATNQPPQCYAGNACEAGVKKNPRQFLFVLGPVMAGSGPDWQAQGKPNPFTAIQPEGITLRVRNVAALEGAELYGPDEREVIRDLQRHLRALDCNPGPADGIVGERTRIAALECRPFPEGALPDRLDVSTMRRFLELYREHYPV